MKHSHYGQSRAYLAALSLALTATFGGIVATPAQAGLFGISEQQEIEAGQEVAQQAEQEYGGAMPANHPHSQRVRALGQQFARLSTRRNIPYTYKVLNNNEVLNAFAAPGGPVYVTRKLVETTANDAELAYVLGHETGHIERKHVVDSVEKQQKVGLAVGILGSILGGKTGNTVGTIAGVGWNLLSLGYSRDDERESDITGVRWMSQLGYDPRAAISMLGKLGGSGGGGVSKYLSTHPDPKSRQDLVQKLIQDENLMDVARRSGGPRLGGTTAGSTNTNYNDAGYYAPSNNTASNNTYPDYNAPGNTGNNGYYPPSGSSQSQYLNLDTPLEVVDRGKYNVVMGPVQDFADWAGATVGVRGNVITLRRGGNTMELRRYSTIAKINGRNVEMSAAADNFNGRLYAPVGNIADGLGARASLESNGRSVRITLDGRTALVPIN